jgi:acyl carrier protein
MIPAKFVQLDRLPLTPGGKLDVNQLKQYDREMQLGVVYEAPESEIQQQLVRVWSKVLSREEGKVGINDSFFDLGGNSLLLVQVHNKLETLFPKKVKITDLFTYITVKRLADFIKEGEKTSIETGAGLQTLTLESQMFASGEESSEKEVIFDFRIPGDIRDRLKLAGEKEGISLNDIFAAAYIQGLYEIAEEEEITVYFMADHPDRAFPLQVNLYDIDGFMQLVKSIFLTGNGSLAGISAMPVFLPEEIAHFHNLAAVVLLHGEPALPHHIARFF